MSSSDAWFKKGHQGYWLGKKRPSPSKETLVKMSLGMKGKNRQPKTEEEKEKNRQIKLGKKRPNLSGNKHPNWQGGKTLLSKKIRNSIEYRLWRETVFKRDNYICIWCGQRGGKLHADHIKPFALFPELRLAIDNGRTLCIPCHKKTNTYGWKTVWIH